MTDAVFRREGSMYIPGPDASGPWSADRLHGGPVFGLIAREVEAIGPDPALVPTRFTLDIFRAVPQAPLRVRTEIARQSGRLCLVRASVLEADEELVSATVLLLRESEGGAAEHELAVPPGPEGLSTQSLMGSTPPPNVGPGFHVRVQTRWVPRSPGEPVAIWFRLPIQLIEGEEPTALQRAVALSDFANAVASIAQRERGALRTAFINVDTTLHFSRRPAGEWFCVREESVETEGGVSVASCGLYDERGRCGRVLQSRLANRMRR